MNPKNKGLGRGLGAIFEIEGKDLPAKKATMRSKRSRSLRSSLNPKQPPHAFRRTGPRRAGRVDPYAGRDPTADG